MLSLSANTTYLAGRGRGIRIRVDQSGLRGWEGKHIDGVDFGIEIIELVATRHFIALILWLFLSLERSTPQEIGVEQWHQRFEGRYVMLPKVKKSL